MRQKVSAALAGKSFKETEGFSLAFKDSLHKFLDSKADEMEVFWNRLGLNGENTEGRVDDKTAIKLKTAKNVCGLTDRQLKVQFLSCFRQLLSH